MLLYPKVNMVCNLILVCSALGEYLDFFQTVGNNAYIRCAVKLGRLRDTERWEEGIMKANHLLARGTPAEQAIAQDYLIMATTKRSSTRFICYTHIDELRGYGLWDIAVCIDGLLDFMPYEWENFVRQNEIKAFYSTMHYCPELMECKDKPVPSLYFDCKWRRTKGAYVMEFDDGSFSYTQSAAICRAWWRSNVINRFFYDPIYANAGYGLFKLGVLEEGVYVTPTRLVSLPGVIRKPKAITWFRTGKKIPVFVTEEKFRATTSYVEQRMADKPSVDWGAIVQYIRSNMGRTSIVGKLISKEWNMLDEDIMDIVAIVIVETSLKSIIDSAFWKISPIPDKRIFQF